MSTYYVESLVTIDLNKVEVWEIQALLGYGLSFNVEGHFAIFLAGDMDHLGEGLLNPDGELLSSCGLLLEGLFEQNAISVTHLSTWCSGWGGESQAAEDLTRYAYESFWEGVRAARE